MNYRAYLIAHLPETLDLLRQMVEINTFTYNAAGVTRLARFSAEAFAGLGLQAELVPSVNPQFGQHAFLSNHPLDWDGPSIALISHLDTVFPPEEEAANDFHWRVDGDRIYGPGTNDIKGGTALIHLALSALKALHPQQFEAVRWLVCLDASEETLSDDFGRLCIERLPQERTLACLVFEGGTPRGGTYPVVVARKGRAEFRVTASGRGAHAGNYHHQGANAVVQMAHTIQKIAGFTDYANKITFTPG
ncbi:MAG: M20/M25/M40 family metallo-hydrolase, partial [Chloroflexota bacterium]